MQKNNHFNDNLIISKAENKKRKNHMRRRFNFVKTILI